MHSPLRRVGLLAAGAIVLSSLGAAGALAAEPKKTSTIEGSSAWYPQAYENFPSGGYLTPRQSDVAGPQRAPFGTNSHRIEIGESSAQTELYRTNAYDGVNLSDLTRLEYSELARPTAGGGDRQPAYLRLSVDTDNNGTTDDSLFFYPANNGTVVNNTWQHWDVAGGTIDVNGDNGGTTTLAQYADANPDATLVNDKYDPNHDAGALSLIVGGALGGDTDPQINGEYFVDRVIVGENDADTLYDLGGGSELNGGTSDLTVDPAHSQGWQHQAYDNVDYLTSNQTFVDGPGTPPAGGGSLRFTLNSGENPDRVELFRTTQYDDTLVRDLRTITFSTFAQANAGNATPQQPAYLRLSVDNDGDGGTDDSLYYYPANNGTVAQGTWQNWDAGNGVWNVNGDQGAAAAVTLDDYVVAHPDATIVENADSSVPAQVDGGTAFLVGGGGGAAQMNGSYFLDKITISKVDAATGKTVAGKRFDLEPTPPTFSIGDTSVSEGNRGATLTFPVTLSRPFAVATSVDYATSNGGALAGSDYRAKSGTLTIPAGSTTGTIRVTVISDRVREASEYMRVTLSAPVHATVADGGAIGRIVNDDTRVGFVAVQGIDHRVRASVTTLAAAPGAPVKVFRVSASGPQQVFFSHLNASGRISVLLGAEYRVGRKATFYATVRTANGLYTSARMQVTIR